MCGFFLRCTIIKSTSKRTAKHIALNRIDFSFDDLPPAFDGFRILHLSDLHIDVKTGIEQHIAQIVRPIEADLCVLTGDYGRRINGRFRHLLDPLRTVVSAVHARHGILGTLGNHDSYRMVPHLESMGVRMLLNETCNISKNGHRIRITGLDDPCYYYTEQAPAALAQSFTGFKIALVHDPSMLDIAAENGYRLYLCGHTHGGQICLPGGIPLIPHLRHDRRTCRGAWRCGAMVGYTSQGTGTGAIPLRLNSVSEITLIRLMGKTGS